MIICFGEGRDEAPVFTYLVRIRDAYRSFLDRPEVRELPGARTARVASAPDAKLSTFDLEAFVVMVEGVLLPMHEEEIAALEGEKASIGASGVDTRHYDHLISIHREKQEKVREWLCLFAERFFEQVGHILPNVFEEMPRTAAFVEGGGPRAAYQSCSG